MGVFTSGGTGAGMDGMQRGPASGADRMSEIPRIVSAEPVIQGVLKIEWDDGYAGIVDLRPVIDRGGVLACLQDPNRFREMQVGEYGHSVFWRNRGEEIDF